MSPDLKASILRLLDAAPVSIGSLPGEVFSSGMNALAPGDLYVVGLNPGFGDVYPTVRKHVEDWSLDFYSAFIDQCWKEECWNRDCYGLQEAAACDCARGTKKHQLAVQGIIKHARPGLDPRKVFATNAIFAKSNSAASFRKETGLAMSKAFDSCWSVHQLFLSIVRPHAILSLGYACGASAFSFFGRKALDVGRITSHTEGGRKYPSFKWTNMTFDIGAQRIVCLVVGVRHPSYVPDAAHSKKFSDLLAGIGG